MLIRQTLHKIIIMVLLHYIYIIENICLNEQYKNTEYSEKVFDYEIKKNDTGIFPIYIKNKF